MKKWLGFSALFIVSYLIFLFATAPASLILNQVKLPKDVVIQGVIGSVWHMKAQKVYTEAVTVEKVSAKLNLLSLLSFNPVVDVTFGDALIPGPEGSLSLSMQAGNAQVENASIFLPANMVAQQLPLPIPMTAQGIVEMDVPFYAQGKPLCQALEGQIHWRRAKVNAFDESITLGRLSGNLGCDNGSIALTIEPDNQLGLTYNAFIGANGRISGNGYLTPGENFPEKLKSVLPFIGTPDNQGRYRLRL